MAMAREQQTGREGWAFHTVFIKRNKEEPVGNAEQVDMRKQAWGKRFLYYKHARR